MALSKFGNTHISNITSLIDSYEKKIQYDDGTLDKNEIIDDRYEAPSYQSEIKVLKYELKIWGKIPHYFAANHGPNYFCPINRGEKMEYWFTLYKVHQKQFIQRVIDFEEKYLVKLSYDISHYGYPGSNEYIAKIYDLRV